MPSEFLKDVLSHLERLWQMTGLTKFRHLWSFAILPLMIRAWCGSCIFDLFSPWCCQSCTSPHLRSSGQGSNKNVQHFTKSPGIEPLSMSALKLCLLNLYRIYLTLYTWLCLARAIKCQIFHSPLILSLYSQCFWKFLEQLQKFK